MIIKQGHTLINWVEGVSDEAYYPWESPKKIRLKSVNPTFVNDYFIDLSIDKSLLASFSKSYTTWWGLNLIEKNPPE